MFFTAIIAAPFIAGVLAGTLAAGRRAPWALSLLCVAIGVAGAVAMALDDDTTGRAGAAAFGVVAGLAAAGLVWLGYGAVRLTGRPRRA